MTDADLQKVFDKIARLKAVEERPGTPGEAAAAAAAISRLAFRYNLSQMQVDNATREKVVGIDRHWMSIDLRYGTDFSWKQTLLIAIARTNFCRAIFIKEGKSRWGNEVSIIGEKHNAGIVESLFNYLHDEIERLTKEEWNRSKHNYDKPSSHAVRFKAGFRIGATEAVTDRLRRDYDAQRKETAETSALVIVKDNELQEAVERLIGRTEKNRRNTDANDAAAYLLGMVAGQKINLAKQIEGET